jgi:hypothetical protein
MGLTAVAATATAASALELAAIIVPVCAAIFASITAPLILAHRTEKLHREDRAEDYRRQDEVASRVQAAADALQEKQGEIAAQAQVAAALLAERQDESAGKAQEAADLLLAAQRATIKRTDEVARLAERGQALSLVKLDEMNVQLGQVHTLVNQNLTDVTERALAATVALLEAQLESSTHLQEAGGTPTQAAFERIEETRRNIKDLQGNLADRATQQAIVNDVAHPADPGA